MIIVNTHRSTHGTKVKLPVLGLTEIPADGVLEVTEEVGALLVNNTGGQWVKEGAEAEQELEATDADGTEEVEVTPPATDEEVLAALDAMSVEEMLQVADQAGIKGHHKFKAKPDVLRNYIKNKLKKA